MASENENLNRPRRLRAEQLPSLLGTQVRSPRLSWWFPAASEVQHSYQIRLSDGASEQVSEQVFSADHVLVPWPGELVVEDLRTRSISVRVWTDLGISDWSDPVQWELLLRRQDWTANWIGPVEPEVAPPGQRPVYELLTTADLDEPIAAARVWATAEGIYELFVNGSRVGDQELTPGFTSYRSRLQVQRYDISGLLRGGHNEFRAVLSDGWFRGRQGIERTADNFGTATAFLMQAVVEHTSGGVTSVTTGEGWQTRSTGSTADLIDGEQFAVTSPGRWQPAEVRFAAVHDDRLIGMVAPPVRRVQRLTPRSVTRIDPDRQLVDLGQNISGVVRLTAAVPNAAAVTIRHAEQVSPDGGVTTDHLRGFDLRTFTPTGPGQTDVTTGPGRPLDPHHSTKGFRYAEIAGLSTNLGVDDVDGFAIHTDLERTGWFECGDERLNKLHEAAVWTLRSNVCDIPTDCPQRERSGFTGDWATCLPVAAFLYDVAGFTRKFLSDLAAEQDATTGRVGTIAPSPQMSSYAVKMEGAPGPQESAVLIPWFLWQRYSDREALAAQYHSMTAVVEYMTAQAKNFRHPNRVQRGPAAAHEEFLWDIGPDFGEWMEPGVEPHLDPDADHGDLATAAFHTAATTLARAATVLGYTKDADHYRLLAANIRAAWQTEYVHPDGTLITDTQAMHAQALHGGLLEPEHREAAAARLVELIQQAAFHPTTGFVSTRYLIATLAACGYPAVALQMLTTTGFPSWLEMLDRGATTIWERWDGIDEHGTPQASLNHLNKGSVLTFLHEYIGGIRTPDPDDPHAVGYRRFVVEPFIAPRLGWARTRLHTPAGPIETFWESSPHGVELTVEVPPGAEATIRLPDATDYLRGSGRHRFVIPAVT